ncbi:hypothetical protein KHS38_04400 [Mucilaginibacter sp. Bleaf8]|uniref:hypothetical protein n=1 Tax=Mucilaginibacter sp. Bleaf8 TaxID=2834430 RepID=UPI001BCE7C6D|nr:hypothetical protein [Mucilaginibacter sp. Bleaf8]MBS7563637.1 hypothetical protein [Mucilaginibacter sp. Bleaf8]
MKIHTSLVCWLLLTIAMLAIACNTKKNKNLDSFYTDGGEWDSARIPFIKPYEAIKSDDRYGWIMNLEGIDGDTGILNIQMAGIVNGTILLYSTNTILHGNDVKEAWYVIIPKQHLEKGFGSYRAYLSYLRALGFKNTPKLHNIRTIASYFDDHETIDWNRIE